MSNIPLETAMEQQASSGASFNLPAVTAAHLLAALVCIVLASAFENGKARAIRFSTLTAICDALDCTPADILGIEPK